MTRPLRLAFPPAVYHLTSRGNARQRIVRDDEDRRRFLTTLAHVIDRSGWLCHADCVMDHHYHRLIETPRPTLSRGMRQLHGVYTQAFNRRHHLKAILVEQEPHLLELCRDVGLNPVRANLVAPPRQWAWSSYRATAGETTPPTWLTTEWVLSQVGSRVGAAQRRDRAFVAERRGLGRPWDHLQGQI